MFFNTLQPYNIFNLSGGTANLYNPLIKYNWQAITTDGIRYLRDSGSKPKYHAEMFTGQGVKFNGVDQGIEHDLVTLGREFSICIGLQNASGWLLGSGLDNIRINSGYARLSIGGTQYDFQESQINLYNNNEFKVIVFIITDTAISLYINGVLTVSLDRVDNNQDFSTKWFSKYSTNFGVGLFNNYILVNKALTEQQIEANYQSPETFLYKDKLGNIKSDYGLDISKLVAYLPICEKDEYVRDLVNYSEVEKNRDPHFTNGLSEFSTTLNTTESNGIATLDGTSSTCLLGDYIGVGKFLIDIGTTTVVGTPDIINTSGQVLGVIESGKSLYVVEQPNIGEKVFLRARNGAILTVSQYSLKQLSGIYPIQNFTSACRDEAKNLNKGLQTAKWKRDSLGVPYALSSYLEGDGVGYADTGWIPNATDSIEIVYEINHENTYQQNGVSETNGVLYYGLTNSNTLSVYSDNLSYYVETPNGDIKHIIIERGGSVPKLYVNGVLVKTGTTAPVDYSFSFYIGAKNNGGTPQWFDKASTRLFKVHEKALTQEEVTKNYNNAVAKGLLT